MLRGTGGAGETLGSARFQRASLRVPRKEPETPGARKRDLTARRPAAREENHKSEIQNPKSVRRSSSFFFLRALRALRG